MNKSITVLIGAYVAMLGVMIVLLLACYIELTRINRAIDGVESAIEYQR